MTAVGLGSRSLEEKAWRQGVFFLWRIAISFIKRLAEYIWLCWYSKTSSWNSLVRQLYFQPPAIQKQSPSNSSKLVRAWVDQKSQDYPREHLQNKVWHRLTFSLSSLPVLFTQVWFWSSVWIKTQQRGALWKCGLWWWGQRDSAFIAAAYGRIVKSRTLCSLQYKHLAKRYAVFFPPFFFSDLWWPSLIMGHSIKRT